jgi:uncharacterized protein YutE (UPF0331/DUF86 family)
MVNVSKIKTKLGSLEINIKGLEDKKKVSKEKYLDDRDTRDIVERRFEKAIQASLDIASHIVASEGFREPANYGDLFKILREKDILSGEICDRMIEMAGFRNVLAHEYSDIKDERVYDHLHNLDRFRNFAKEINKYINEHDN